MKGGLTLLQYFENMEVDDSRGGGAFLEYLIIGGGGGGIGYQLE